MVIFKGSDVVPICRVPLITSQREEQALITANNMKPVVKLLINRFIQSLRLSSDPCADLHNHHQAQQQVQLHGCKRRQPFEEH